MPDLSYLHELREDLLRMFDASAPCRNWTVAAIDRAIEKAQEKPMTQEPRVRVRIDRQEFSVARDAEITHDEAIRMVGKDPESTLLYWIRGPGQSDTCLNAKPRDGTTLLVLYDEERAYFTAPRIINQSAAKAQEPAPVDRSELREQIRSVIDRTVLVDDCADRILALLPAQGDEDARLRNQVADMHANWQRQIAMHEETRARLAAAEKVVEAARPISTPGTTLTMWDTLRKSLAGYDAAKEGKR